MHELPETGHIPSVGFTADCGRKQQYEEVLRGVGIMECLEKPVSMTELEAVIQAVCPIATGLIVLLPENFTIEKAEKANLPDFSASGL